MSSSTCLRADLENSNIGSVNKSQAPSKKKPDGGLNEVAYSQHKGITLSEPQGTLKTRRRRIHRQGILSGILGGIHWRAGSAGYSAAALVGYSAGFTGELLWRDTRRDPLATLGYSAEYSAGSLASSFGGILGGIHWRAARRDPLHWRAALAGYWRDQQLVGYSALAGSAGSTGEQLWRDPLASRSGGILGGIHWRAALAGYSAGSTGELLWRDTGWGHGVEASQTRIPT